MRGKEYPESKAEQDGRRFSFACALQGIGLHRFRLYLHGFREYSFPEKKEMRGIPMTLYSKYGTNEPSPSGN